MVLRTIIGVCLCFFSQGVKQYEEEENKYEQMSDKYEDLSTFLKSKSHHFTENIHRPDEVECAEKAFCPLSFCWSDLMVWSA